MNHFTHRCGCGAILRKLEPCPKCTQVERETAWRAHSLSSSPSRDSDALSGPRCRCAFCRAGRGQDPLT